MFSALGERTRRKSGNEVESGLTLTRTVAILKMSSLFDIARYSDQRGARKVRPVLHFGLLFLIDGTAARKKGRSPPAGIGHSDYLGHDSNLGWVQCWPCFTQRLKQAEYFGGSAVRDRQGTIGCLDCGMHFSFTLLIQFEELSNAFQERRGRRSLLPAFQGRDIAPRVA